MREAGVEADSWNHDADAVRADQPQEIGSRRVERLLLQFLAALAQLGEARGDDDRGARAALAQLGNETWNGIGGRRDHGQIGCYGKARHVGVDGKTVQRGLVRIDGQDRAGKAGAAKIAQHDASDRIWARRCANQRDGARLENLVEIADRHRHLALRLLIGRSLLPIDRSIHLDREVSLTVPGRVYRLMPARRGAARMPVRSRPRSAASFSEERIGRRPAQEHLAIIERRHVPAGDDMAR